jgi:hypothetical protein
MGNKIKRTEVVDAEEMVGVGMSEKNRVNAGNVMFDGLVPKIGARVDEYNPTIVEGNAARRSVSVIARVFRRANFTGAPGKGDSC